MKYIKFLIKVLLFVAVTVGYIYLLKFSLNVINLPTILSDNFFTLIGAIVYVIIICPLTLTLCNYIEKHLV